MKNDKNNNLIETERELLSVISRFAIDIVGQHADTIESFIVSELKKITNSTIVVLTHFDPLKSELCIVDSSFNENDSSKIQQLLGRQINGFVTKLDAETIQKMISHHTGNTVSNQTIHEASLGSIPQFISDALHKVLKIAWITGFALVKNNELIGSVLMVGRKNVPLPEELLLTTLSGIITSALERKYAEESAFEKNIQLNTVFHQSPSVIEVYDKSGLQIEVNKSYEELWGFPASHTVGKFNLFNSKEVKKTGLLNYINKAYLGECVVIPEYIFNSSGETEGKGLGRSRWLSTTIYPLKNHKGEVENIVISHIDVSERREAELSLNNSKNRLEVLLKNTGDLLFVLDKNQVFIEYYGTNEEDLIFPPSFFIGKNIREIGFPDYAEKILSDTVSGSIRLKKQLNTEYFLQTPTGKEWYRLTTNPIIEPSTNEIEKILCVVNKITSQKNQEEIIREREEKLYITLNSIGDGVISTDENGLIQQMNPIAEKLCGYSLFEAKNKPLTKIFKIKNSETGEDAINPVEVVLKEDRVVDMANHTVLISKHGIMYHISDSAAPIKDKFGITIGVVLVFSDVTEKYKTQQLLRDSELRLRNIIQNIPGAVFRCLNDKHWTMLYLSNHFQQMSGYPASDFIQNSVRDFASVIHPDDKKMIIDEVEKGIFNTESFYVLKYRIIDATQKIIWVEERGQGIFDDKNNLLYIDGIITDITEQLESKNREIASERKFKEFTETLPEVVFEIDINGKLLYANKRAAHTLGYANEDITDNLNVFEFIHPEDRALLNKNIELSIKGEKIGYAEYRLIRKNGSVFPALFSSIPFYHQSALVGFRGFFIDITEQKRHEMLIQQKMDNISFLANTSMEMVDLKLDENIYEYIVKSIGHLNPQAFITCNSLNEEEKYVKTEAIFAPNKVLKKITSILGNRIIGQKHYYDSSINDLLSGKVEKFKGGIHELSFGEIPKLISSTIETVLNIGPIYGISFMANQKIMANAAILFPKGTDIKFVETIEAFAKQVAINIKRLNAERALKESEKKYRLIAENMGNIVSIIDLSFNTTYISQSIKRILGFTPEEYMKLSLSETKTKESFALIKELFELEMKNEAIGVFDPNRIRVVELQEYKKDKSIIWGEYVLSFIRDENGKPISILCVMQDITDRKNKENQIKLNEQRLQSLVKISQIQTKTVQEMLDLTLHEAIQLTNSKYGYIYFYSEEKQQFTLNTWSKDVMKACEVIEQQSVYDLEPTGLWGEAVRQRKPIMENNYNNPNPYKKGLPEGHVLFDKFLTVPVFNNQEIVAVVGVSSKTENYTEEDIRQLNLLMQSVWRYVDLKNAEQKLAESEQSFKTIFNSTNEAFFIHDIKDGSIIDVNQRMLEMFGYKSKLEVLGKTMETFSSNEENHTEENALMHLKKAITEGYITFEWRAKRNNGDVFWLDVSLKHILLGDKAVVLAVTRDISDRKESEIELIKAKEKAIENDRLKSAFLANISHEIRTPMNGILGFAELLKTKNLLTEEKNQYIKIIEQSGQRMLNIINDIVDISKIEAGQVSLNLVQTNIKKIVHELCAFFEVEAHKNNITLIHNCSISEEHFWVNADLTKLNQILSNLIKNALKFTTKGYIEVGFSIQQDKLQFHVKDSGQGISEAKRELIFERFRQGDTSLSRPYEGAGLGLAISKAYIEMMGGKIWVESEVNIGSTFFFTIDYNPIKINELANPKQLELSECISPIIILIVEDDPTSLEYLKRIIRNESAKTYTATNGKEAIKVVSENSDIQMVLMDLKMPEMDGYEAIKHIKHLRPNLPVIAQTAHAFSEDENAVMKAGFDDYISKPIRKELLYTKINKIMNKA